MSKKIGIDWADFVKHSDSASTYRRRRDMKKYLLREFNRKRTNKILKGGKK